mmetsp:Transcript_76245/g.127056  ORF Transcript_76245/g.127056 Transcript_76245/m.127056 type:complete len:110 (+) Transcript_76245:34-363(+)
MVRVTILLCSSSSRSQLLQLAAILTDVQADWRDTLQSKTLAPRIEECGKVLKNGENLRKLSDMSASFADYLLLVLQSVPNVQEDWNIYTCTEKCDIEGPQGLVKWWETR